jgi:hypothetical protein
MRIAPVFTVIGIAVTLAATAAFAEERVLYHCDFSGSGTDTSGSWEQQCHASGQFVHSDGDLGVTKDSDNTLTFDCIDGRHGGAPQQIFNGEVRTHLDTAAGKLWLEGMGVDTPRLAIELGDRIVFQTQDRTLQADLTYTWGSSHFDFAGNCRLQ